MTNKKANLKPNRRPNSLSKSKRDIILEVVELVTYKDGKFFWKEETRNRKNKEHGIGTYNESKKRWILNYRVNGKDVKILMSNLCWLYHFPNQDLTGLTIVNSGDDYRLENLSLRTTFSRWHKVK